MQRSSTLKPRASSYSISGIPESDEHVTTISPVEVARAEFYGEPQDNKPNIVFSYASAQLIKQARMEALQLKMQERLKANLPPPPENPYEGLESMHEDPTDTKAYNSAESGRMRAGGAEQYQLLVVPPECNPRGEEKISTAKLVENGRLSDYQRNCGKGVGQAGRGPSVMYQAVDEAATGDASTVPGKAGAAGKAMAKGKQHDSTVLGTKKAPKPSDPRMNTLKDSITTPYVPVVLSSSLVPKTGLGTTAQVVAVVRSTVEGAVMRPFLTSTPTTAAQRNLDSGDQGREGAGHAVLVRNSYAGGSDMGARGVSDSGGSPGASSVPLVKVQEEDLLAAYRRQSAARLMAMAGLTHAPSFRFARSGSQRSTTERLLQRHTMALQQQDGRSGGPHQHAMSAAATRQALSEAARQAVDTVSQAAVASLMVAMAPQALDDHCIPGFGAPQALESDSASHVPEIEKSEAGAGMNSARAHGEPQTPRSPQFATGTGLASWQTADGVQPPMLGRQPSISRPAAQQGVPAGIAGSTLSTPHTPAADVHGGQSSNRVSQATEPSSAVVQPAGMHALQDSSTALVLDPAPMSSARDRAHTSRSQPGEQHPDLAEVSSAHATRPSDASQATRKSYGGIPVPPPTYGQGQSSAPKVPAARCPDSQLHPQQAVRTVWDDHQVALQPCSHTAMYPWQATGPRHRPRPTSASPHLQHRESAPQHSAAPSGRTRPQSAGRAGFSFSVNGIGLLHARACCKEEGDRSAPRPVQPAGRLAQCTNSSISVHTKKTNSRGRNGLLAWQSVVDTGTDPIAVAGQWNPSSAPISALESSRAPTAMQPTITATHTTASEPGRGTPGLRPASASALGTSLRHTTLRVGELEAENLATARSSLQYRVIEQQAVAHGLTSPRELIETYTAAAAVSMITAAPTAAMQLHLPERPATAVPVRRSNPASVGPEAATARLRVLSAPAAHSTATHHAGGGVTQPAMARPMSAVPHTLRVGGASGNAAVATRPRSALPLNTSGVCVQRTRPPSAGHWSSPGPQVTAYVAEALEPAECEMLWASSTNPLEDTPGVSIAPVCQYPVMPLAVLA